MDVPTDLVIATWNLEHGGETRGDWSRLETAADLWINHISQVHPAPHVLLLQEFRADTPRLQRFARAIGAADWRRACHPDRRNRNHLVTMVRDPARITGWVGMPHWLLSHACPAGLASVALPGWPELTVANTHLSPFSPDLRLIQAAALTSLADRGDGHTLLGGDLNAWDDNDPAPDFSGCTRAQITHQQDRVSRWWWRGRPQLDTRALSLLADAGFVDAVDLTGDPVAARARVTSGVWPQPQAPATGRKDRLLLAPTLAERIQVVDYYVYDDPAWRKLSDHLPVAATLRLAPSDDALPNDARTHDAAPNLTTTSTGESPPRRST